MVTLECDRWRVVVMPDVIIDGGSLLDRSAAQERAYLIAEYYSREMPVDVTLPVPRLEWSPIQPGSWQYWREETFSSAEPRRLRTFRAAP